MALWDQNKENGKYIIGFEINNEGMDSKQEEVIRNAMKMIEDHSCIQFKDQSEVNHRDYIEFVYKYKCWSYVGRQTGNQTIMLDGQCIQHEYMIIHEVNTIFRNMIYSIDSMLGIPKRTHFI